ncbi:MAG: hypothetical protein ACI8TP_001455 [Acidimicrobiales bacterium]|jgi:hypothetical protein
MRATAGQVKSSTQQVHSRLVGTVFWRSVAVLVVMMLTAGACSGGDDSFATESFDQAEAGVDGDDSAVAQNRTPSTTMVAARQSDSEGDDAQIEVEAAPSSGDEVTAEAAVGAATPTGLSAASLQRKIIFTATVVVEVDDVVGAGDLAVAAVEEVGGFVFGQQTSGGAEPTSTSQPSP